MKRLVSISLLVLLLYHNIGYFLFFQLKQNYIRQELRQAIEAKTQPDQDWFVIAIPIVLYHQLDRDFEIVEGEFSYQGKVYEKAMQRIQNDTLFIYCVNNLKQEEVRADLSEHLKTHLADAGNNTQKKSDLQLKSFLKNYYLPQNSLSMTWASVETIHFYDKKLFQDFPSQSLEVYTPPPQSTLS